MDSPPVFLNFVTREHNSLTNDAYDCVVVRGATYHAHCTFRDTHQFRGRISVQAYSGVPPTKMSMLVDEATAAELRRYYRYIHLDTTYVELKKQTSHRMLFDDAPRSMEWHVSLQTLGMRFLVWFTEEQCTGLWIPCDVQPRIVKGKKGKRKKKNSFFFF
jgi:hypothetical protein